VNVLRTIEYVNKIWVNNVTTCSNVPLEKLLVSQIVKIFFLFQYLSITVAVEVCDMVLCPSVNGYSCFRVSCFRVQVVK
jgi:hypothetical protein